MHAKKAQALVMHNQGGHTMTECNVTYQAPSGVWLFCERWEYPIDRLGSVFF